MNSDTDIFQQPLTSPPISPHVSIQVPHVLNTSGKTWDIYPSGRSEILLGGEFDVVAGISGGLILTIQS